MSIVHELKIFAKNQKILVVEDDEQLRLELVGILKLFYAVVEEAADGLLGLEVYKRSNPDVILSDITMPNMNGVEMIQNIKNINREQAIIVLSAHNELEYMIDLIDMGIDQFVAKPFEQQGLLYRLLKVSETLIFKKEFERYKKRKLIEGIKQNLLNPDHSDSVDDVFFKSSYHTSAKEIVQKEIKTIQDAKQDKEQSTALNKNLGHKQEDASSFMKTLQGDKELWLAFEGEVDNLVYLNEDFENYIEKIFLSQINNEILEGISITLRRLYSIFLIIDELHKMAHTLFDLASYLEILDADELTDKQILKLKILEFIYDDISRFIQTVFVYQDTIDIHYLEDSIQSSVDQLKLGMGDASEFEEEELELF